MPLSSNVAMFVPDIMCTLRCEINNIIFANSAQEKTERRIS